MREGEERGGEERGISQGFSPMDRGREGEEGSRKIERSTHEREREREEREIKREIEGNIRRGGIE